MSLLLNTASINKTFTLLASSSFSFWW